MTKYRPVFRTELAQRKHYNASLLKAAQCEDNEKIENILDTGADINFVNDKGETALFKAINSNHTSTVALLLQKGANVNVFDGDKKTPAFRAAEARNSETFKLLMQNQNVINLDAATKAQMSDFIKLIRYDLNGLLFHEFFVGAFSLEGEGLYSVHHKIIDHLTQSLRSLLHASDLSKSETLDIIPLIPRFLKCMPNIKSVNKSQKNLQELLNFSQVEDYKVFTKNIWGKKISVSNSKENISALNLQHADLEFLLTERYSSVAHRINLLLNSYEKDYESWSNFCEQYFTHPWNEKPLLLTALNSTAQPRVSR